MLRPVATRPADRLAALARLAARTWWTAPLLVLLVALDDALLVPRAPNYAVLGLLDEPAHLATSAVLLCAMAAVAAVRGRRLDPTLVISGLLAGNLIDADHLPMLLGTDILTATTPRPYSHSLGTVLVLLALLAMARRRRGSRSAAVAAGAMIGVVGHLVRDLGTAPVALFWPVTSAGLTVPHPAYLVLLAAVAVVAAVAAVLAARPEVSWWSSARAGTE